MEGRLTASPNALRTWPDRSPPILLLDSAKPSLVLSEARLASHLEFARCIRHLVIDNHVMLRGAQSPVQTVCSLGPLSVSDGSR